MISIYAWPLLSASFDPDLLMEADLVAVHTDEFGVIILLVKIYNKLDFYAWSSRILLGICCHLPKVPGFL